MLFSVKERYEAMRRLMLAFLMRQIENNDFSVLHKLYERAQIDNKKLLEKAHTIRNVFKQPSETIFSDMVYLIYDISETNTSVLDYFYEITCKLFSYKVNEYEKLLELYRLGNENKWVSFYEKTYCVDKKNYLLYLFHLFLPLYNHEDDELCESCLEIIPVINYSYLQTDQNLGDSTFIFNSEENIFDSTQFERYIDKRKEDLATYLSELYKEKVTADNLSLFISNTLKSKAEEQATPLSPTVDGIVTGCVGNILVEQFGGLPWYSSITNDGKKGYKLALNYQPNIDLIIHVYFKEYIKNKWINYYRDNEEGFSKIYLSRDCIPQDQNEVWTSIMYLYNIDVMCKLFNNIKDDYYLNFSWEKVQQQDIIARYNITLSEMEDTIKTLKTKLDVEKENSHVLREQFTDKRKADETALQFERTLSEFNKKLEKKDEEIIRLKRQLENKEEYIQLLANPDDPEIEQAIDISILQNKKYLFVGHAKEALPDLKKVFPNSLFMETEGFSLTGIQVDGIVMLIKYMSHSMYYKICSTPVLKNIPWVRCNTKNINSIYNKMMTLVEEL